MPPGRVSTARGRSSRRCPVPRRDLEGRLYSDFQALPTESQLTAVEMDCVCGKRGERPAILTLMFRQSHLQLMLYLPEQTSSEVAKALDMIERLVGYTSFRRLFGTILTDRGAEFLDFEKLERICVRKSRARCKVFFCDPMKSNQKSLCERNHAELRRIIPKGTSLKRLTPRALAVACSHVNSYGRPVLGGATPYQIARLTVPVELLDGLGIVPVPAEEVSMHPSLVERCKGASTCIHLLYIILIISVMLSRFHPLVPYTSGWISSRNHPLVYGTSG